MKNKYLDFYRINFGVGKYCVKSWGLASYKAGAQSRQSEVDELQKKYDAMYRAFIVADDARKEWHRCYVGVRQREDELQKRIDEALKELEYIHFYKTQNSNNAIKILKGESNE